MRYATALILLATASATAQPLWSESNSGWLWDGGSSLLDIKETKPVINLVPSTVTETALPGVTLFNDRDHNRYGSVTDIGNGQQLINTQGTQNTLRLCQRDTQGNMICN